MTNWQAEYERVVSLLNDVRTDMHNWKRQAGRYERALKKVVQIIDREQPIGNGHKVREAAAAALLRGAMSED